jgi:hypothetical protein
VHIYKKNGKTKIVVKLIHHGSKDVGIPLGPKQRQYKLILKPGLDGAWLVQ